MNVGTGIILGLLIGALAMLLADWFFYRNRRVCAEAEEELRETNNLLISERDGLQRQVKSFDGQSARVGALEADLDTRTKQYNLLLSDHEKSARRYRDLEARYKSTESEIEQLNGLRLQQSRLEAQLGERDAEIANLQAALAARDRELNELNLGLEEMGLVAGGAAGGAGLLAALRSYFSDRDNDSADLQAVLAQRDAEIANLRADLDARDMEIGSLRDGELADLRAELNAKDVELGELHGQMDEWSIGLEEMGIAAGGAVGGAGLLAALRSRLDDSQSSDLEVAGLQADLAARNAEIAALSAEIGVLKGTLDVANASTEDSSIELDSLRSEVNTLRGQLAERDGELAELDAEVNGLDIDWGKMGLAAGGAAAGGGLLARLRGLGRRLNEQDNEIAQLSVTPEVEPIELNPYVIGLQGSLSERDAELAELRARLAAQSAELDNVRGELDARGNQEREVAALRVQLEERAAEVARIRAEASARSAELQRLNAELSNRSSVGTQVNELRTAIDDRDQEILHLRTQLDSANLELSSVNTELGDANLGWLAGAGAVGAGGAIVAMKSRISDLETELATCKEQGQADAHLLALHSEEQVKPDNLTKIWGIGSVIQGKLNENGIYTFEQLANTDQSEIDAILADSGGRFRLATPAVRSTWQEQARLAAVGDWDEFDKLKSRVRNEKPDDLTKIWGVNSDIERSLANRGIDTYRELEEVSYDEVLPELEVAQADNPRYSKREIYGYWIQQSRWAMNGDWDVIESQVTALATPPEPDDLTKIWGIGKGLEGILNDHGIYTFAQLAEAPEDRLDEIIEEAGPRYRIATRNLHNTWSAQAEMAAADDWEALQVYQDKLSWSDRDSEQ